MKPVCGIYLIENKITKQKYVGQSVNCWRRINEHCSRNTILVDQAIKSFGRENFSFFILRRCGKKSLTFWEQYYIYKYNTYYNGYNDKVIKDYQDWFKAEEK